MPDIEELIKGLKELLKLIYGDQAPSWILPLIGYLILTGLLLFGFFTFIQLLSKIKDILTEKFLPLFYNPDEKRRSARRMRFADHLESEIRRLNNLEAWSDYRFAELEAEVEAEGRRRTYAFLPFSRRTQSGLRREKSLSKALEASRERLIILEGDPGSGKSVALRYIAQSMARRAINARSIKSVIPIYINLKELERRKNKPINKELIRSFIWKSLNRVSDRDIEEFLEEEFDRGLQDGTWLFLFDSFDELPEVLSSTEADTIIRSYADAISDFLHGLNQCRGIIASRQFRGPGQFGWPRFHILPLSEGRRFELIHKADLKTDMERDLLGQLGTAAQEIHIMATNPMFLGLLCEYMRTGNPFPQNAHHVFESYIGNRLTRDSERLQRRFRVNPREVRLTAEVAAFCMAADQGLGLSPTRRNLKEAMARQQMTIRPSFDVLLDALEYLKIARSETATITEESRPFTFAHRRFQEYFATCVVLREPDRVSPRQLLTNARWRETAVVMCQTQPKEVLVRIINEVRCILNEVVANLSLLIEVPTESINTMASEQGQELHRKESLPEPFPWPSKAIHILGLLQDGFGSRLKDLPDDIRANAGHLVLSASNAGSLFDRKWALEVAGIIPSSLLLTLLRDAFKSNSQWLKEVAYRQASRLREIPDDIAQWIRQSLMRLARSGRLRRERHTTFAFLARLDKSYHFISTVRLLLWIPPLETIVVFTILLVFIGTNYAVSLTALKNSMLIIPIVISDILLWKYAVPEFSPIKYFSPSFMAEAIFSDGANEYISFFIVTLMRFFFYFTPLLLILPYNTSGSIDEVKAIIRSSEPSLLLQFFLLYATSWFLTALWSAERGRFTHPLWWCLLPICSIFYFTRRVKAYIPIALIAIKKNWKEALVVICKFLITGGLSIVGLLFIIKYLESHRRVFIIVIAFIFFVVIILLLVRLIQKAFHWIKDWIHWQSWEKGQKASITGNALLKSVEKYHFPSFAIRVIRTVREQSLLIKGDETTKILELLAIDLEYDGKRTKSSGDEPKPRRADVRQNNKIRWSSFGPEFLDEICRLLEQVRANRTSEEVSDFLYKPDNPASSDIIDGTSKAN